MLIDGDYWKIADSWYFCNTRRFPRRHICIYCDYRFPLPPVQLLFSPSARHDSQQSKHQTDRHDKRFQFAFVFIPMDFQIDFIFIFVTPCENLRFIYSSWKPILFTCIISARLPAWLTNHPSALAIRFILPQIDHIQHSTWLFTLIIICDGKVYLLLRVLPLIFDVRKIHHVQNEAEWTGFQILCFLANLMKIQIFVHLSWQLVLHMAWNHNRMHNII